MNKKKEPIIEYDNGCKISIDREGIISMSNCPDIELGGNDIDMLSKIKDIITEDEVWYNWPKNI